VTLKNFLPHSALPNTWACPSNIFYKSTPVADNVGGLHGDSESSKQK